MRTRAAVAVQARKPLEVTDVNLEGSKAGEVLVEIKATGICHTDEFTCPVPTRKACFPLFWATREQASWSMLARA